MARVDPRVFSNNPPHDGTNAWLGVLFAAIGSFVLVRAIVRAQHLTSVGFGLVFVLMGAALLLARFAEPRPEWQREDPPPLLRPWAMMIARVLCGATSLLIAVVVATVLATKFG